MNTNESCPICVKLMEPVFKEILLGKYHVNYYFCTGCGFLKTEKPYWLNESYSDAIAPTDTGLLSRNLRNRDYAIILMKYLVQGNGKYLDVSGGYGVLTRLLRDKGFDCYTTDKYCKNLFAKEFEPDDTFEAKILFAFEVFEHIENPKSFLEEIFKKYNCRTILFSTTIFEKNIPDKNWWYYAFETGQHISFYQKQTLNELAKKVNCKYYNFNQDLHIITDSKLPFYISILFKNRFLLRLIILYNSIALRKVSRTFKDYNFVKNKIVGQYNKENNINN